MKNFNFNFGKDKVNLIFILVLSIIMIFLAIFNSIVRNILIYFSVIIFIVLLGSKVLRMHKEGMADTKEQEKLSDAKAKSIEVEVKTKAKAVEALIQTGNVSNIEKALEWKSDIGEKKGR